MEEQIWNYIAGLHVPGFFITADIVCQGDHFPDTLKAFIYAKREAISQGITARKFTFHAEGWHMHLTFFPTDRVVDERYALKNRSVKF